VLVGGDWGGWASLERRNKKEKEKKKKSEDCDSRKNLEKKIKKKGVAIRLAIALATKIDPTSVGLVWEKNNKIKKKQERAFKKFQKIRARKKKLYKN
jgi:hypothetical protein